MPKNFYLISKRVDFKSSPIVINSQNVTVTHDCNNSMFLTVKVPAIKLCNMFETSTSITVNGYILT